MGVVRIAEDGCLHPPLCTKVYYGTIHNYLHIMYVHSAEHQQREYLFRAALSQAS
jgi:hypothetical protein